MEAIYWKKEGETSYNHPNSDHIGPSTKKRLQKQYSLVVSDIKKTKNDLKA